MVQIAEQPLLGIPLQVRKVAPHLTMLWLPTEVVLALFLRVQM
jgi:hypothetical protein